MNCLQGKRLKVGIVLGMKFNNIVIISKGGTEMTLDEAKAMLRFMIYNPVTEEEAEAIEVVLEALAE